MAKRTSRGTSNSDSQSSSSESFFVRIGEPEELRREILESSKMMIHVLQSQKKLETIREEKSKKITEFRKLVKEINLVVAKLKKRLPKTKLRALSKEEQMEVYKKSHGPTKTKAAPKKKVQEAKPKTEVDALQSQLDAIESKLKKL